MNKYYEIHHNNSIKLYGNTKKKYLVLLKYHDQLKFERIIFLSNMIFVINKMLYCMIRCENGGYYYNQRCCDEAYEFYFQIVEKNIDKYDSDIFNSDYCNYDGLSYKWNNIKNSYTSISGKECIILDFWDLDEFDKHKKYFRENIWKELVEKYWHPNKIFNL
uniref:Uncharacterized protein n=1 Tax=viral metagenome TaxID=1070528 RepID=A0A6C0H503_9ZZZZ